MSFLAAPIISGLGSLFGGIFGESSAVKAARIQSDAALKAAAIQQQEFGQALDFQKGVYGTEQRNLDPYITAGQGNLANLEALVPSLTTPYSSFQAPAPFSTPYQTFTAPTRVNEQNDPGYKFRLQQGEEALQNSAAARGGLLSGGTAKAFEDYAQNYASNEYQNVYNRAFQNNALNYGQALQTNATNFGQAEQAYGTNEQNYYTGQGNQFNRLAALAGQGLSAAGTLGAEGTAAGGMVGNTLARLGESQAAGINNAAAASASGVIGGYNALQGGITGGINAATGALTLNQLQAIMAAGRGSGYGNPTAPTGPTYGPPLPQEANPYAYDYQD